MKEEKKNLLSTRAIAYCAMLAAISVVLARLIVPMPNEFTRFSIEAVPIFLAGILFGPLAGGCVGFGADLVGCLFSGYGYNPIFCVPPILYGVFGGVFGLLYRKVLHNKLSLPALILTFLPPVVLGSVLYQSCTLAYVSYGVDAFWEGLWFFLGTRSIQFAITMVLDVVILYFLLRSNMFRRMKLL